MSEVGSDVAGWARAHRACFEVAPLVEVVKERRLQVGFTVALYAQLPLEKGPGQERRADAAKVWEGLREIVGALAPAEGGRARLEIEPLRTAAFFRPENEMKPEIGLSARIFHGEDYLAEVTPDERDKLSEAMKRLTDMGLKQGHW